MTNAWKAESARLFEIKRRYLLLLKEVKTAQEEGVRCVSRTGKEDMDLYWLVDRDERILTGEHGTNMEAWISYLGKDKV